MITHNTCCKTIEGTKMITHYEYIDPNPEGWCFEPIEFGKTNLIVGASSSGKTRFLNSIFNIGVSVAKGEHCLKGKWKITAAIGECVYTWEYCGKSGEPNTVESELLTMIKAGKEKEILIQRSPDSFIFEGKDIPQLIRSVSSITLLKEHSKIEPFYKVFPHIKFQRFDKNALERAVTIAQIRPNVMQQLESKPDLNYLYAQDYPISANLYCLKQIFPERYKFVIDFFKQIFQTVEKIDIELLQDTIPRLFIKEKSVKTKIPLEGISSGMIKALLIITDIISLSGGCTYIMDEYENSLGINVIDFLPELLLEYGGDNQFLITTHHPYLINNMPMKNWLVFNRKGSTVRNRMGRDLEEKYGKSKQQTFIQLINDPFYKGIN